MNIKVISLSVVACVSAIVLTSCMQDPMVKKLSGSLLQANIQATKLFGYTPDYELVSAQSPNGNLITISAHGYGANKKTGKYLAHFAPLTGYVLTFNLPDYDYRPGNGHIARHGTIHEILPLAYAVKTVIDAGLQRINLYGFSAGGAAVINLLLILYTSRFDTDLNDIGITLADKAAMIAAIERGIVILDVPLKSAEEAIDGSEATEDRLKLARHYRENNLRPIDSLVELQGMNLKIVLYFENPDEVIFNRDDAMFIKRLKAANSLGITEAVSGSNGGHISFHKELWEKYQQITTN